MHPFVIIPVSGKGLGAVANRDIRQGELILNEKPLFSYTSEYSDLGPAWLTDPVSIAYVHSTIQTAIAPLSKSARAAFLRLNSGPALPSVPRVVGICRDNCLAMTDAADATYRALGGIFPLAARFNSSCLPNVNQAWTMVSRSMRLYALRDVARGEELCICYAPLLIPRQERQLYLRYKYGFVCMCAACTAPLARVLVSDQRRIMLNDITHLDLRTTHPVTALKMMKVALKLLNEEGLINHRHIFIDGAFQVCAGARDRVNAKIWAERALQAALIECGEDSTTVRLDRKYFENPRSHPSWGSGPCFMVMSS